MLNVLLGWKCYVKEYILPPVLYFLKVLLIVDHNNMFKTPSTLNNVAITSYLLCNAFIMYVWSKVMLVLRWNRKPGRAFSMILFFSK